MLRTARRVLVRTTFTRVWEEPRTGADFATRKSNVGAVRGAGEELVVDGAGVAVGAVAERAGIRRGSSPCPPNATTSPATPPAAARMATIHTSTARRESVDGRRSFVDKLPEA
jgi:hypothetical protein